MPSARSRLRACVVVRARRVGLRAHATYFYDDRPFSRRRSRAARVVKQLHAQPPAPGSSLLRALGHWFSMLVARTCRVAVQRLRTSEVESRGACARLRAGANERCTLAMLRIQAHAFRSVHSNRRRPGSGRRRCWRVHALHRHRPAPCRRGAVCGVANCGALRHQTPHRNRPRPSMWWACIAAPMCARVRWSAGAVILAVFFCSVRRLVVWPLPRRRRRRLGAPRTRRSGRSHATSRPATCPW
jgi:hypothetical protein